MSCIDIGGGPTPPNSRYRVLYYISYVNRVGLGLAGLGWLALAGAPWLARLAGLGWRALRLRLRPKRASQSELTGVKSGVKSEVRRRALLLLLTLFSLIV